MERLAIISDITKLHRGSSDWNFVLYGVGDWLFDIGDWFLTSVDHRPTLHAHGFGNYLTFR